MAEAERLTNLPRALDANGDPISGATWTFYITGTTALQSVYSNATLTVAHSNPVVADAGGKFAPIYFNAGLVYRGILRDGNGATIEDIDPINSGVLAALASSAPGQGASLVMTNGGDSVQAVLDGISTSASGKAQAAAVGVEPDADDMGVFMGSVVPSGSTAKSAIEAVVVYSENARADITSLQSSYTGLSSQVASLSGAISGGSLAYATRAALYANTTAAAGVRAEVYNDGTVAYNGSYVSTGTGSDGSRWTYFGADRVGKVEAATGAPLSMFRAPIIYDPWGLHSGGARTVYVPRHIYARLGSNVLNNAYGTASSIFPDHVALTIDDSDPAVVYLDLDDTTNPQKITNFTTLPSTAKPDKIIIVAEIFQYRIKTPHPVVSIENPDKEHISFRWPLVVENGVVMVPPFYHYSPSTLFTFYSPSDGSLYWELDLNTSQSSEWRYYFDRVAAEAGQTPVKVADGGSVRPLAADNDGVVIEFGVSVYRGFKSDHTVLGLGRTIAPNMLIHGDDPYNAPLYESSLTTIEDVSSSDLTALGFTQGFGGQRPMPRLPLGEGTPKKGWVFCRVYQEASADDEFITPTIYVQDTRGGNLVTFATTMEKKISARAAIFSRMAPYDLSESPSVLTVGIVQSASPTNPVIHCGVQMYAGPQGMPWIMRGDFGRKHYPDLLYPAKHYSVDGRKLPFFRQGMIPNRSGPESVSAFTGGDNLTGIPFTQEIGEGTLLDYDEAGDSFVMMASGGIGNASRRAYAAVENVRAEAPMSGAFNVLCIGDSNTNRGLPNRVKDKLTAMGFTPTMVGTMANEGGSNGEGRGSWEWDDFYGADSQFPAVAIGGEAAYLALSAANGDDPGRWANNPFLRPSTGGDDPDHVFGGVTFDIASYLSRFSVATPKYVPVLLGTNDMNLNSPATALAQIQLGLEIILPNLMAALPSAFIGVGIAPLPRTVNSDQSWSDVYVPALRSMMQFVANEASNRLDVLPLWAHMSPNFGWSMTTKQALGDRVSAEITDDLHYVDINRSYAAETVASWIACKETGA